MDMRFAYDLALDLVLNGLWSGIHCLALEFEFRPFLMALCREKGFVHGMSLASRSVGTERASSEFITSCSEDGSEIFFLLERPLAVELLGLLGFLDFLGPTVIHSASEISAESEVQKYLEVGYMRAQPQDSSSLWRVPPHV
ncbi:hypothetical protein Taro_006748 [Colocasia esculenta]|uniref:Uncharacterized protein n=1 Tax=Colocasia esculenta TaxID=4460 RepID=A0A843TS26_COLES|nr:hypothetical protein [Colocasia esculenta]